jgi:hypothetical protein
LSIRGTTTTNTTIVIAIAIAIAIAHATVPADIRLAFGFAAALLESIPIAGLFFSISNRIGAAMW